MSATMTIARPYAKAAFDCAVSDDVVSSWSNFLQREAVIIADNKVGKLLDNPKIPVEQKKQFLFDLCQDDLSNKQRNFIEILTRYKRLSLVPTIAYLFELLRKEKEKIITVDVTSTFPMDDEQQERIKTALKNRLKLEISLETKIDKKLLGGAIIKAGDLVIDGSNRGKLDSLKRALLE